MKKILFILIAITSLTCCDYYIEEEHAQSAFYVVDSTECEVRGVWELDGYAGDRRTAPNKRYAPPPPNYFILITPEATYEYNWQDGRGIGDDIMAQVPLGDTVRVRGTVRTITNGERTFQDIIVDSILEIKPPVLFRYIDTVENTVIQGRFRPYIPLDLSDYAHYRYPAIYLPKPNAGYPSHPYQRYYINPNVNFKVSDGYQSGYLCGVYVWIDQWVVVTCDLITGLTVYDESYYWINMKSAQITKTPEQYKD